MKNRTAQLIQKFILQNKQFFLYIKAFVSKKKLLSVQHI